MNVQFYNFRLFINKLIFSCVSEFRHRTFKMTRLAFSYGITSSYEGIKIKKTDLEVSIPHRFKSIPHQAVSNYLNKKLLSYFTQLGGRLLGIVFFLCTFSNLLFLTFYQVDSKCYTKIWKYTYLLQWLYLYI